MSGCMCPCHDTTAFNTQGCPNCHANHGGFSDDIFRPTPQINVYPDNNTQAILQKLSEILEELKEIKKRLG